MQGRTLDKCCRLSERHMLALCRVERHPDGLAISKAITNTSAVADGFSIALLVSVEDNSHI